MFVLSNVFMSHEMLHFVLNVLHEIIRFFYPLHFSNSVVQPSAECIFCCVILIVDI